MHTNTAIDIPAKPRVLIADDSRIVRATLIKHIEGLFEFREALDGEQAWEILLLDQSIRVVITDLTMPKLDGYGLLRRIRASKISRIRNIPVIVVSGSDEAEERERAKAAGATDLITKGIGTAQLLSRLDILSQLANTQSEFERSLEALVHHTRTDTLLQLSSPEVLQAQAELMLTAALGQKKNFVILNTCIALQQADSSGNTTSPPKSVITAVGQLLQRTVRQTDYVAQTGEAEFTLATGNIHFDSARNFARRVCGAIANAHLIQDDRISLIATCGMVALSEYGADTTSVAVSLKVLRDIAHRRAKLGLAHATSGVVGAEEEAAFQAGPVGAIKGPVLQSGASNNNVDSGLPDLSTLLQWAKEGKRDQVLQYIDTISAELKPLLTLVLQQTKP
jgi:two-component system cell cycle response regulator